MILKILTLVINYDVPNDGEDYHTASGERRGQKQMEQQLH